MPESQSPAPPRTGPHLSIGEVLALLLEEFPDVTISKIRFLESQGLIDPERTASGYRKFYGDDVELLRCILREQRENYLPLKVIKDRIDSGEIDPTNENPRPRGIKNVRDPQDHPDPAGHPSAGGRVDPNQPTGAAALFQRTDQLPDDAPSSGEPAPEVAPRTAPSTSPSTSASATSPSAPPAVPDPHGAVLPGLLLLFDELCAMAGLTREQLA